MPQQDSSAHLYWKSLIAKAKDPEPQNWRSFYRPRSGVSIPDWLCFQCLIYIPQDWWETLMHMRTLVVYPNLWAVASGSQRHLVMAYVASHMLNPYNPGWIQTGYCEVSEKPGTNGWGAYLTHQGRLWLSPYSQVPVTDSSCLACPAPLPAFSPTPELSSPYPRFSHSCIYNQPFWLCGLSFGPQPLLPLWIPTAISWSASVC